ncbi:MAG: UDP-N-acetylmuramate dehydrogenase, partial [Trebonia sp.]
MTRLADLTTLRLGGPAREIVTASGTGELVEAVRAADGNGEPVLIVGGGSNLVVADEGWPGVVVLVRNAGVTVNECAGHVDVTVQAGVEWDAFVARTVRESWSGLATTSGIPGLAGATPVQNVGAYGTEVAELITGVTVLDRNDGAVTRWGPRQCEFGFRTSVFKHTDRYLVLDVSFRLSRGEHSAPVRYLELARRLGVEPGDTAPLGK